MRIWVNTELLLTSLTTEIARSARGPKLQEPHADDAMAKPYLEPQILVRNNHRYAVVVLDLGHPMDPVISVQSKNFSGNTKELAKVLGAE